MRRKHPADEGPVSEADRAYMELQARTGRPIDVPAPPSRTWFGRLLDLFESAARGSRGNHWR